VRHGGHAREERGPQVHGHLPVPFARIEVVKRHVPVDRRHVDDDVEASQGGGGFVHRGVAVERVGQVGTQGERATAAAAHGGGRLFGGVRRGAVDERHIGAALGEHDGDGLAHAGAPGDECGTALQGHKRPPAAHGPLCA